MIQYVGISALAYKLCFVVDRSSRSYRKPHDGGDVSGSRMTLVEIRLTATNDGHVRFRFLDSTQSDGQLALHMKAELLNLAEGTLQAFHSRRMPRTVRHRITTLIGAILAHQHAINKFDGLPFPEDAPAIIW